MVIDLSRFHFNEQPILILRNPDGTPIGVLGTAYNIQMELHYNEVSTLEFTISAFNNGVPTPYYKETVGMRIVELKGIGQFVLNNPSTTSTGVWETKRCSAYSLEREFVYKNVYLEKNVYNFWNPLSPGDSVLGILMERYPAWAIGEVDSALVGKYRSLDDIDDNGYNVMKSTLQDAYGCIFDFDTYHRRVNAISAYDAPSSLPVYLSLYNLIKQLDIQEDDENIATCLGVRGADGLSIAPVNPMGGDKLYNLDYFMDEINFAPETIEKYRLWKAHFKEVQEPFYNLTVEQALKESQAVAEEARLTDLQGELKALEGVQATWVELLASHDYSGRTYEDGTPMDADNVQAKLSEVNRQIREKRADIAAQKALTDNAQSKANTLQEERQSIVNGCQFDQFFDSAELMKLEHYIKESSIQDSSFSVSAVKNYAATDTSDVVVSCAFTLSGSKITKIPKDSQGLTGVYTMDGGRILFPEYGMDAQVVRASAETGANGSWVFTAYLSGGTIGDARFPSGTLVFSGTISSSNDDLEWESKSKHAFLAGTEVTFSIQEARMYMTENLTEWERRSVAWELFQYGQEVLEKAAQPSYTFTVDAADFLSAKDFEVFKDALSLGKRVYLEVEDGRVLSPVLIVLKHSFAGGLKMEFSNKYTTSEDASHIVDLLKQSVSMGKKLDLGRESYTAFVDSHANNTLYAFINSALDVSKNAILSSTGQAFSWDENGGRFRKWTEDHSGYEPEQIGIINNSIVFTEDNWEHVKMAVGLLQTNELGKQWGVVADSLIGRLMAGQNLYIYGTDSTGETTMFRVDGEGMYAYNSRFWMESVGGGAFAIDPAFGLGLGYGKPFTVSDDGTIVPKCIDPATGELELDKDGFPVGMNLWAGLDGQVYVRGNIYATDGVFNGTVYAKDGEFSGAIKAATLDGKLVGSANAEVDLSDVDYIDLGGMILDGRAGSTGIRFKPGYEPVKYQFAQAQSGPWHNTMQTNDKYRRDSVNGGTTWGTPYQFRGEDGTNGSDANVPDYIQSTYIDATKVESFYIRGNKIEAVCPKGSEQDTETGFILTGGFEDMGLRYLRICSYTGDIAPYVSFSSPNSCYALWDFGHTVFRGSLDFSPADVSGLHLTLA